MKAVLYDGGTIEDNLHIDKEILNLFPKKKGMIFTIIPSSSCPDCDTVFGQKVLNIAVTEIESVVQPESITDNIGRENGGACIFASTDSSNSGHLSCHFCWLFR